MVHYCYMLLSYMVLLCCNYVIFQISWDAFMSFIVLKVDVFDLAACWQICRSTNSAWQAVEGSIMGMMILSPLSDRIHSPVHV